MADLVLNSEISVKSFLYPPSKLLSLMTINFYYFFESKKIAFYLIANERWDYSILSTI